MWISATISPAGWIGRIGKSWTGIRILQVCDRHGEQEFTAHERGAYLTWGSHPAAWTPNGRYLVHGGRKHEPGFQLFDLQRWGEVRTLGDGTQYQDLTWDPGGQFLLVSSLAFDGEQTYRYELELMKGVWIRGEQPAADQPFFGFRKLQDITPSNRIEKSHVVRPPRRGTGFGFLHLTVDPSTSRIACIHRRPSPAGYSDRQGTTGRALLRDELLIYRLPEMEQGRRTALPEQHRTEDLGWLPGDGGLIACFRDRLPARVRGERREPLALLESVKWRRFAPHPHRQIGAFGGHQTEPDHTGGTKGGLIGLYDFERDRIITLFETVSPLAAMEWVEEGSILCALTTGGKIISHRFSGPRFSDHEHTTT